MLIMFGHVFFFSFFTSVVHLHNFWPGESFKPDDGFSDTVASLFTVELQRVEFDALTNLYLAW